MLALQSDWRLSYDHKLDYGDDELKRDKVRVADRSMLTIRHAYMLLELRRSSSV